MPPYGVRTLQHRGEFQQREKVHDERVAIARRRFAVALRELTIAYYY